MTTERPTSSQGDHFTVRDVVASYNAGAPTLAPGYEDLPFEEVHASVLDLRRKRFCVPNSPST